MSDAISSTNHKDIPDSHTDTPQLFAVSTGEIHVDDTFIENPHAEDVYNLQDDRRDENVTPIHLELDTGPADDQKAKNYVRNTYPPKKSDPFAAFDQIVKEEKSWKELSTKKKLERLAILFGKIVCLLVLLYLFVCSLGFLGDAFKLIGGKTAGRVFSSNKVLSNPVAGLMIGVLATVLLQSSSTTSSIVVAMVASGILKVRPGIPIVMGANIGTSVTNTIVALTQIGNKDEFRRAFAGATVHDMFNMLCVIIFLPLEIITGYLYELSNITIEAMNLKKGNKAYNKELLKVLTKPFTDLFVQLDQDAIIKLSEENNNVTTIIKYWCGDKNIMMTSAMNGTIKNGTISNGSVPCKFLFNDTGLNDSSIGVIMLIVALFLLCTCLVLIVKILNSMLKGHVAKVIKKTINSDFPYPFGFLTGYFAILVGAIMTFLVQSSSIFTSAMTPLVGVGVVSLERIYPLTLGSNIGTTATSILAALASSSDKLAYALQIALCHLFFNISGILLFYPVPRIRKVPINGARYLGNQTAKYRWYAVVYMILGFFVIPACFFGLSLSGWKVFIGIFVPIVVLLLFICIINVLQRKRNHWLPDGLRTWNWLPRGCRSLSPYDELCSNCMTPCRTAKPSNKQNDDIVLTSQSKY